MGHPHREHHVVCAKHSFKHHHTTNRTNAITQWNTITWSNSNSEHKNDSNLDNYLSHDIVHSTGYNYSTAN